MDRLEINSTFTPETCAERIRKHKSLLSDLEKYHIDIKKVSSLFSYALSDNERWDEISAQKRKLVGQSKDAVKKVRKRHASKPPEWHREDMLRAYTNSAMRKIFSKELTLRRTGTKTRPHIQRLAYLLYFVISQTMMRPYRLMAGLFHIFPELLGIGCRRSCRHYAQGACTLSRIFLCSKHQSMRQAIRQITIAAAKSYPPDMLTHLTSSEKEND